MAPMKFYRYRQPSIDLMEVPSWAPRRGLAGGLLVVEADTCPLDVEFFAAGEVVCHADN
jgi:hypothetical protein